MKRRRCRGVAAIEAALALPVLLVMLAFMLDLGRVAWYRSALDNAAAAAARYLARQPLEALQDPAQRGAALAAADSMVQQILSGAGVPLAGMSTTFLCGSVYCSAVSSSHQPLSVEANVRIEYVADPFSSWFTGVSDMPLDASVRANRVN